MIVRKSELIIPQNLNNFINDSKISMQAKGLLMWILTNPDDYQLTTKEITMHNKATLSQTYNSIDELERFGYIHTENYGTPDMRYIVYDHPVAENSIKFKHQKQIEKSFRDATKNYINQYLKPNRHFKRIKTIDAYWLDLNSTMFPVDFCEVSRYIKDELTYDEFLSTEYWEIISYFVKIHRNFTCERCGQKFTVMRHLNVHHKTYENHGSEHILEVIQSDLELLCETCHVDEHIKNGTLKPPCKPITFG